MWLFWGPLASAVLTLVIWVVERSTAALGIGCALLMLAFFSLIFAIRERRQVHHPGR